MKIVFRLVLTLTALLLCLNIISLDWLQFCYATTSNYSTPKFKGLPTDAKNSMGVSDVDFLVETVNNNVNFQPTRSKCKFSAKLWPLIVTANATNLKNMTMKTQMVSHIVDYFSWTNQSACQISHYFGGLMVSSASGIVSMDGQKAICLDPVVAPRPDQCIVYSFGINYEWSFDDAMDLYGCKVFSFDPSMNVSNHSRSENVFFYQMALSDVDKNEWKKNFVPSRTLSSIYKMLQPIHGTNVTIDYLKIDIESAEWIVLPQILKSGMLDKVRQLSVEIHMDFNEAVNVCCEQANIIHSLEDYGMVRFDSKPNVYSVITLPQRKSFGFAAYEIAWYNNRVLHLNS
ncbi:hypothetical protein GHT06_020321 [Daphnia sinensis]|uniref:Methyltransferase domain-containing protein n=1 Tax=Daphnia sinensis TaxID=1820382 RepID=A0AAD5KLA3_9CRUS|nr:hypothetical protein GHT06_020321 [Daphnia sinensis]